MNKYVIAAKDSSGPLYWAGNSWSKHYMNALVWSDMVAKNLMDTYLKMIGHKYNKNICIQIYSFLDAAADNICFDYHKQ
jgi:hypothetical protein